MNSRHLIPCLVLALAAFSFPAHAQVSISLDIAPPPLVVEDQPPIPGDGYIWTPGYWAYDDDQGAYYWVAGSWEQPPEVGVYWTPSYWGWDNNSYVYYPGYWGPTVGFYGGVNYGHGYWGNGYGGGRWDNGHFAYNTAANNVRGTHLANTYADRSVVRPQSSRVSFNGGKGGIQAQATPQELQARQENHVPATAQQQTHLQTAEQSRSHQVKVNAHNNATANAGQQPQGQPAATPAPAANPAPGQQQFTGENNQEHRDQMTDRKTASPDNQPKPAANPAGAQQFTGETAEQQHRDAMANDRKTTEPNNQPKPEVKQETPNDHPVVKNVEQPAPNDIRPEVKHTEAEVQHSAGPAVEAKPHIEAPAANPHPQAQAPQGQPHVDAKPQGGKPEVKADGGPGKDDKH